MTVLFYLLMEMAGAEDERSFVGDAHLLSPLWKKTVFEHSSPEYLIDLDGDGNKERIHFINRDGRDWIFIKDFQGKRVYQYGFRAVGLDATPFKIRFRSLSPSSKVLVIHYHEGYTDYLKFLATARLYFLTFENNDLKTLNMYRGPWVFYEQAAKGKYYRQRTYKVGFVDLDGNGTRDIEVGYGRFRIKDVFLYRGKGKWFHLTGSP